MATCYDSESTGTFSGFTDTSNYCTATTSSHSQTYTDSATWYPDNVNTPYIYMVYDTSDMIINIDSFYRTPDVFNLNHYKRIQRKINEAWELWCRQERFAKRNQIKIGNSWKQHLYNEERRIKRLAINAAEEKAVQLLEMLIGKEIDVYRKTGRVFVKGKRADYIVKKSGGITKIKKDKVIDFCVHIQSKYKCPPTDHVIALKMMLEEDDKKVLKIANKMSTRTVEELPMAACM